MCLSRYLPRSCVFYHGYCQPGQSQSKQAKLLRRAHYCWAQGSHGHRSPEKTVSTHQAPRAQGRAHGGRTRRGSIAKSQASTITLLNSERPVAVVTEAARPACRKPWACTPRTCAACSPGTATHVLVRTPQAHCSPELHLGGVTSVVWVTYLGQTDFVYISPEVTRNQGSQSSLLAANPSGQDWVSPEDLLYKQAGSTGALA